MLVATQRGRERTAAEYGALLRATGFARPEVRRMQNVLERHSVVGWKAKPVPAHQSPRAAGPASDRGRHRAPGRVSFLSADLVRSMLSTHLWRE